MRSGLKQITAGMHRHGHEDMQATKFCMVAPNIQRSSVWKSPYITVLVSRILRLILLFLYNLCAPALQIPMTHTK